MTLKFFVVLPYIWDQSTLESFSETEEPLFSKSTLKNLNIPQKLRKMCSGHNFLASDSLKFNKFNHFRQFFCQI